ncbi:hypothetical protein LOK49_LG08G02111 [Camellia lanceoleosa]|uniref:Uncharacterized protein n=1 Tax=Camellia lanceoleosa TaxID=1840588 RepID=A0ACC0GVG2_9ERIC|nr:hypothetical protein LOK49_LG08G02111 [Camellia lanceoleosa]
MNTRLISTLVVAPTYPEVLAIELAILKLVNMSISYNIFISLVFSCNQTGVRGSYDLVNNGKILVSDSSFEPQRFSKGEAIHRLKNEVDFEVDSDANGEVVGNSVDVEYRAGDENGMGGNSVEELFQQNQDDKNERNKIRELSQQLAIEKKRAATYKRHLEMVFEHIEEHNQSLSKKIQGIVDSVREMESKEQ